MKKIFIVSLFFYVLSFTSLFAEAPPLTITFPNEDTILTQGDEINITWTGSDEGVTSYPIYLTGGSIGESGLFLGEVNVSEDYFNWTVPSDLSGSDYQIQFRDANATMGFFGPSTQQALSSYQASVGISPANGIFGPLTRTNVSSNCDPEDEENSNGACGTFDRNLSLGSEGEDVANLQIFLTSIGYTVIQASTSGANSGSFVIVPLVISPTPTVRRSGGGSSSHPPTVPPAQIPITTEVELDTNLSINITEVINILISQGIIDFSHRELIISILSQTEEANRLFSFNRNLTLGSQGPDVADLQTFLTERGYLVMPANVAKGYFGPLTQSALASYQAANNISPSAGFLGPITRNFINSKQ